MLDQCEGGGENCPKPCESVATWDDIKETLGHVMTGHGTITAVVIGLSLFYPAGHRSDNFHGGFKELLFDGIGSVVTGAALDCFDLSIRHQLEDIARFHAEILHALMASSMIGHFAQ